MTNAELPEAVTAAYKKASRDLGGDGSVRDIIQRIFQNMVTGAANQDAVNQERGV